MTSHIIIGSSNIKRLYVPDIFPKHPPYEMVKCVNMDVFKVRIMDLSDKNKFVIISVLENLFADAVKATLDQDQDMDMIGEDDLIKVVEDVIKDFCALVKSAAERLPASAFILVHPIQRPALEWYFKLFPDICSLFEKQVDDLAAAQTNVARINSFAQECQQFDDHGVHLTPDSMKIFIESVLSTADQIFDNLSGTPNLPTALSAPTSMDQSSSLARSPLQPSPVNNSNQPMEVRVTQLEDLLHQLSQKLDKKTYGDNMMMTRIREELDMMTNTAKEDRIILTGLTNSTNMPADGDLKKKWLHEMVGQIFDSIDNSIKGRILFVNHGKRQGRDIPMVEVKLESRETALKIRKAFVAKKRSGHDFGRLHLANSVTLATRIRSDVMRAISAQFSVEGKLDMFVSTYSSRPVLHVKETYQDQVRAYALTYADAVAKYGDQLDEQYLNDAYRKVGSAFKGQLEQHFLVLKDSDIARAQAQPPDQSRQRGRVTFRGRTRGQHQRGGQAHQSRSTFPNQGLKRPLETSYSSGSTSGQSQTRAWGDRSGQGRGGKGGKFMNPSSTNYHQQTQSWSETPPPTLHQPQQQYQQHQSLVQSIPPSQLQMIPPTHAQTQSQMLSQSQSSSFPLLSYAAQPQSQHLHQLSQTQSSLAPSTYGPPPPTQPGSSATHHLATTSNASAQNDSTPLLQTTSFINGNYSSNWY